MKIENCEPPSTIDSYTVASSIRQIAHKYGVVKTFKAYAAVSEVISPRLSVLRSELTACGVSFVDCPHNGRKDVADKMMIGAQGYSFSTIVFELLIAGVLNAVDMMAYAMDTPAPATIILISGDRDFAYAVALLRLRKYRIVVVAPTAVHNSLKLQASHFYDWFQNVSHSPSRPSIPSTRTPSGAMRFPEPPSPGMERLAKTVNSLRSSAPVFVPSPPTKGGDPDTDRGVLVESESETVERVDTTTLGASDPSEVSILESNGGDSMDDPSESTVQTTIAWTAPVCLSSHSTGLAWAND